MAEQRALIYLRGTDQRQIDDAAKRCSEYADRFGWQVLESVHDHSDGTSLNLLLTKVDKLEIQIIITGSLDMISPDQEARDNLMTTIERDGCIVHPVNAPSRQ